MKVMLIFIALSAFITVGEDVSICRSNVSAASWKSQEIDLSGEWVDSYKKRWEIFQAGQTVEFIREDERCGFKGMLEGRTVKYTTSVTIKMNPSDVCHDFIDEPFVYDAQLVVSEDGNQMKNKVPDSVSKGQCKIDLKDLSSFTFTRATD